jgi:hypothetical protein
MTNFDEFKQIAKDKMETIADRSVELYKIAEEKTKLFAKMTRLSTEVALEKGTVRRLYKEIGKKYYELHKASSEDELTQACAEVTSSLECIAAKLAEIEELKKSIDCTVKEDDSPASDVKAAVVNIIVEDFGQHEPTEADIAPDNEDVID